MKIRLKVVLNAFPIEETETWHHMSPELREINAGRMVVEHLPVHGEPGFVHIWKKEDFEREYDVLPDNHKVIAAMEEAFERRITTPEGRRVLAKYSAMYLADMTRNYPNSIPPLLGMIQRILVALGEEAPEVTP